MSAATNTPDSPLARRYCAVCWAALPTTAPAKHHLCLQCWRWTRLGAAIKSARRWMEGAPHDA